MIVKLLVKKSSLLTVLVFCFFSAAVISADTTRDLQNSVHRLKIWLGQGDSADGWREYLDLNLLESQAAQGERANIEKLSQLYNRFSSEANGLDLAPFTDVRYALKAQIYRLSEKPSGEILFEIGRARDSYKQISIESLAYRRDRAVYDLEVLKRFYKSHLYSRERAGVFYDLNIDGLISDLKALEFQLPPDISVGKLRNQLKSMEERIEEVRMELDDLPELEDLEDLEDVTPPQTDDDDGEAKIEGPKLSGDTDASATKTKQENQSDDLEQEFGDSDRPSEDLGDDDAQEDTSDSQQEDGEPVEELTDQQKQLLARKKARNRQIESQQKEIESRLEAMQKEYDELKELRDQIRKQDSDRQKERVNTWRVLSKAAAKFEEVSYQRNDRYFTSSYDSFSKFALLYFYGTDDNLQEEFNEVLDRLEQEIFNIGDASQRDSSALVSDAIGWLEATELAPRVVLSVKERYSQPNLKASVSGSLFTKLGSRPITDARRVNEQLFGRLIRGNAYTNGQVSTQLLQDPDMARVSIVLDGNTASQTYTRAGRFTGYGAANASFQARQNIAFNIGGMLIGKPYGAASLNSEFYGIDSRLNVAQRIANRQYETDRVRNERESARRLEQRVMDSFEDESAGLLQDARDNLRKSLKKMTDNGGRLPELYLSTTTERLWLNGHRTLFRLTETGRVSNLGAPIAAGISSVNADVAIQVHETMLSNYLDMRFNNQTYTNNELADLAEELTGKKSEGLASEDDDDGWSITFAGTRPIQFEFDNNAIAITVSGRRFSQGGTRISAGLKIRIPMKVKRIDGKLKLIRDGEATIDYAEPDKKNAKIVAFRSFLETKLNSSKGKEADDDKDLDNGDGELGNENDQPAEAVVATAPKREGILLPENLLPVESVEFLQDRPFVKQLRLVELRMVDGWLYLGWNHVDENTSYYTGITDLPGIWQEYSVEPVPPQFPPVAPGGIEMTYELPSSSVLELRPVQSLPVEIPNPDSAQVFITPDAIKH